MGAPKSGSRILFKSKIIKNWQVKKVAKYNLEDGYICNLGSNGKAIPYLDDKHSSGLYQYKVYLYARKIINSNRINSVLDIGCGYGIKLKEIIYPGCSNIIGIDCEDAIKYCRNSYDFGEWYKDDIEKPVLELNRKFDMIISSDVIEHLVDPNKLLDYIKLYSHNDTQIIISTPDRDKIRCQSKVGPTINRHHVREWNMPEFNAYVKSRGVKILKHFLLAEKLPNYAEYIKKILLFESIRKIQVVHCKTID